MTFIYQDRLDRESVIRITALGLFAFYKWMGGVPEGWSVLYLGYKNKE